MRWKFETVDKEAGFTVKIKFPSATSRSLTIDGEEVPYNKWINDPIDNANDGYGPIT